ncbi:PepSY domain-containing protein [Devosia sp. 919]|uniref:PepSY domain-containing protein n=1 Tax=Devosia sp. 919 TaxID=2726065 RepID=UPI001555F566|nr:PepSY domain-containing protein [Devosia sp. 919]
MFSIIRATAAAALLLVSPAALAAQSLSTDNDEINGRSAAAMIANLSARGINATAVELWGDGVLSVSVRDADGAHRLLLVDEDTLRPLEIAPQVSTELNVGVVPSASPRRLTNLAPESLVEDKDD